MFASPTSTESRFTLLVVLAAEDVPVDIDRVDLLDCLLSVPPDIIPETPRLARLAKHFAACYVARRPGGLPEGLREYLEDWLDGE